MSYYQSPAKKRSSDKLVGETKAVTNIGFFNHFPKDFLRPYGHSHDEGFSDEDFVMGRLKTRNCEWLLRPSVASSELADTIDSNIDQLLEVDTLHEAKEDIAAMVPKLKNISTQSGSDDNEDPNDGDGDDGCENDDFANQEDIEAIEYSSDGGGDGSDNSTCSNDNDNYWQDDLMNQESNNYGLNDFDDCEDDEIELARKAGLGFLDDRGDDDLDTQSTIGRKDWYYENYHLDHRDEYEAEILGMTESRATDDPLMDTFHFFI